MGELYNPFPKLPKNIRQIGERDQIVKLYVEDYVNTYLKRLYPIGGQDLRVGLLLGTAEQHDGVPYIFIDGALEMEEVTEEGEKVVFSETAWKKTFQNIEQMFPKRTVQGWFLCGAQGCQLSPLNYWKQHGQYFPEKNQLMYLNSGLEGEESIYVTSEDGFYKLRGHSIYYERNQMMQDYMILRKDVKKVETGIKDPVIRDFRQKMEVKKAAVTERRSTVSLLGGLCTALSIVILAGGIVMFNNYEKLKQMEGVVASVMPSGSDAKKDYISEAGQSKVVVEEISGQVFPTKAQESQSKGNSGGNQPASGQTAMGQADSGQTSEGQAGYQQQNSDQTTSVTGQQGIQPETMAETVGRTQAAEESKSQADTPVNQDLKTYTVGEGETLYGICIKLYNSMGMIDEICRLNGLDDQDKIVAGQKLIVP